MTTTTPIHVSFEGYGEAPEIWGSMQANFLVTQHGQQITAQSNRIDGVQASLAGKVDASVVQAMDAKVNNSMTGGGNLLANATFSDGLNGWSLVDGTGSSYIANGANDLGLPTGITGLIIVAGASGGPARRAAAMVPVEEKKTYIASSYVSGPAGYVQVDFYNSSGGFLGGDTTDVVTAGGGQNIANSVRAHKLMYVPDGATQARFWLCCPAATGHFARFFRPMLEQARDSQTQPSPWAAGGQESSAEYNLSVRADTMIAGLQVKATGETSEINFLSNVVNILTPGGADGIEMTNGYIRVWSGNSQRIIGNNFGSEGLIEYFGPNVGAANATKQNATVWMDRNGNAYWGGALSAGILRNAAQSTSIQTVGNSVLVGPFDTNGRNKQVVVGFNRRHVRTKNAYGPQGFVAGAGTNGGVINLYRTLNGQAEQLWQQIPIGGSVSIMNEVDGPDVATSAWNASITLNDSADGSTRRSYRAEIVSFTEQSVSHSSGSFDSQTITQSLSIVSIEQ